MKYDKELLKSGALHGSTPGIDKNVHTDTPWTGQDLCRINRRFMGAGMSQSYVGIYFFEYYQESNNFEYVVEFGSQKGSLSTYYANMAAITEKFFYETYEFMPDKDWYSRPNEGVGHWFDRLAEISPYINRYHQDVFSQQTYDHVKDNIDQFKTFIFCDGGDKASEFNLYAPLIKPGDRIAVHDWGEELVYDQIRETCEKYSIIPDEHWAQTNADFGTLIMPFRRTDG